jgi:hypothetical protein
MVDGNSKYSFFQGDRAENRVTESGTYITVGKIKTGQLPVSISREGMPQTREFRGDDKHSQHGNAAGKRHRLPVEQRDRVWFALFGRFSTYATHFSTRLTADLRLHGQMLFCCGA